VWKGREKGCGRLSVFKGREARLNKAIFHILAQKGPLTIYEIYKEVKQRRFFHRRLYSVIYRRVRALEQHGFVQKAGTKTTLPGSMTTLYRIIPRAYLAMRLDQTNLDVLIQELDEATALSMLAILTFTSNTPEKAKG
jgi:DNA-binding PadR family transcriptional regulator